MSALPATAVVQSKIHWSNSEVLEGSSSEDEVQDETFGRVFPRSRTRRGEARNFSLFFGLFEDETRNSSEFRPFSQPF